jgi:hypothetical protein
MAKARRPKARPTPAARSARGPASGDPHPESAIRDNVLEHEEIARLAYSHWEARGRQGGSPEEDWFRAEKELKARWAKT